MSLYFTKLNVMLTQSNFIFSKFFSREYSLLAAAPMGSSLKRRQSGSNINRGGIKNTSKEEFQAQPLERFKKPLILTKSLPSYSNIYQLSPMFCRVSLPSALLTFGAILKAELYLSKNYIEVLTSSIL